MTLRGTRGVTQPVTSPYLTPEVEVHVDSTEGVGSGEVKGVEETSGSSRVRERSRRSKFPSIRLRPCYDPSDVRET